MAVIRRLKRPKSHSMVLFCIIFLSWFSVFISAAVVTLDSIEIYETHEYEWLNIKPSVYFQCKGENMTYLPDVKKKHIVYSFKGEESWQPLTELTDKKCKRCGLYEKDSIKPDDVFDEWEFCASDFTRSDGKYVRITEKEFNATFMCLDCVPLQSVSAHSSSSEDGKKETHWILVGFISCLVVLVAVFGTIVAYKYWQRRKRQQDQARFLRLFEDNDDIDDELGIGPLSHAI